MRRPNPPTWDFKPSNHHVLDAASRYTSSATKREQAYSSVSGTIENGHKISIITSTHSRVSYRPSDANGAVPTACTYYACRVAAIRRTVQANKYKQKWVGTPSTSTSKCSPELWRHFPNTTTYGAYVVRGPYCVHWPRHSTSDMTTWPAQSISSDRLSVLRLTDERPVNSWYLISVPTICSVPASMSRKNRVRLAEHVIAKLLARWNWKSVGVNQNRLNRTISFEKKKTSSPSEVVLQLDSASRIWILDRSNYYSNKRSLLVFSLYFPSLVSLNGPLRWNLVLNK